MASQHDIQLTASVVDYEIFDRNNDKFTVISDFSKNLR